MNRVHRVMKGFGEPWQLSVFFCVLKEIDVVRLRSALEKQMNLKEDQALIVDLGPEVNSAKEAVTIIGQSLCIKDQGTVVI